MEKEEEDPDLEYKREISAQKIQEIYRAKRTKQKLYIGYDSTEFIILRIYVSEYDQNKKIKSLEIHIYSKIQKKELILNKTIKELLGVDSISVNGIKIVMSEIIEKVLQQNDETINIDKLSEIQREENKDTNINNVKKSTKTKYNEEEMINDVIKENSYERFEIENNEQNIEDKNEDKKKESINNEKVHNDSSLEDANYDF